MRICIKKIVVATATQTILKGQPESENNYEAQPIAPQTTTIKMKKRMSLTLAPYSFVMLEVEV